MNKRSCEHYTFTLSGYRKVLFAEFLPNSSAHTF